MVIDRALFAQECVRQGTFFRVNPHYLLGVAQFRSGISDDSVKDEIGPFRLTQGEWNANSQSDEFGLDFSATQIGSAARQCAVVGLMAHRGFDAFVSKNGRSPSVRELFVQQWPDGITKTFDANFRKAFDDTAALIAPAAGAVLDDPKSEPPLITAIDQTMDRPVPQLDPQGAPEWYQLALKEIGTREEGNNSGEAIARYRRLAQCGDDHDPWCAIFANAMFALCAPPLPGTRSPSSQSFLDNANFRQIAGPALGAVAVFWRGSPRSGLGHVGFYRGETSESIYVLGGNEDDMVEIAPVSKHQLKGLFWPVSVPQPAIAVVKVPPGTPKQKAKLV
jgi:uncharacterized protein (TIGR02594 family)